MLMRRNSRFGLILTAAFISLIPLAQAAEVHVPPYLGFITLDITPQTWSQLNPDHRFKGKVGNILNFSDIEDIYVLRCFMHLRDTNKYISYTVERAIPPQAEFTGGALPERIRVSKDKPLLTIMFKTQKGTLGLMNIYAGLTIIELNQRYGVVLNEQR